MKRGVFVILLMMIMLITCGAGKVTLMWNPYRIDQSPDVWYLKIYHCHYVENDTTLDCVTISGISPQDTVWTIENIKGDRIHQFWMVAVDSAMNVSESSNKVELNLINPVRVDSLQVLYQSP